METPAITPNIQGLPPGATLKPIQGLPPGAELKPIANSGPVASGSAPLGGKPGNAFTSGDFLGTVKANYQDALRPSSTIDGSKLNQVGHDFGRGATEGLVSPFVHPIDTLKGIFRMTPIGQGVDMLRGKPTALDETVDSTVNDFKDNGASKAIPHLLGQGAGSFIGGELTGEAFRGIPKVSTAVRTAAIGDTDAAALRGMRVPANGKKVLPMQSAVQTARPYFQGVDSLTDLQSRVPAAKNEAFGPYRQTLDAVGSNLMMGPDGMTTIQALEDERQQLSAMNRGLRTGDPAALQLAQQKGLSQADALAREKLVQAHLDPELSRYGIDPQGIRQTYSAISRIGNQIEGRSTLLEKPQPSGFGRMANIDLKSPKTWLGEPMAGVRDLIAGRPAFSMSPTDVGIREGFANAGPKPNFGQYTPIKPIGLLKPPPIELGAAPEIGGTPEGYRPPPFYHDTTPMRTGRLLNPPPIRLGGAVEPTPQPTFRHDTTPMRFGRILPPAVSDDIPMSSHADIFPEQLPNGTRIKPKTIEGKK